VTPEWLEMSEPRLQGEKVVFAIRIDRWCWLRPSFWRFAGQWKAAEHPITMRQEEEELRR
jgi:hypothetical protein